MVDFRLLNRDHPRVGGEKASFRLVARIGTGSPPRGRGKDSIIGITAPNVGITPAWAGKRNRQHQRRVPGWDHPRVGGEKTYTAK